MAKPSSPHVRRKELRLGFRNGNETTGARTGAVSLMIGRPRFPVTCHYPTNAQYTPTRRFDPKRETVGPAQVDGRGNEVSGPNWALAPCQRWGGLFSFITMVRVLKGKAGEVPISSGGSAMRNREADLSSNTKKWALPAAAAAAATALLNSAP